MDNRIPYTASGHHNNDTSASAAAAASAGSFVSAQQQNELELLIAEQQQHRHHHQQQQRAALHAAAAASIPHEQRHNFPSTMLPPQHGNNMNNPITMRHDTSLSNFIGNNNRNDPESAAAIQSMLLSSSNISASPSSLPFLRQFEPMNQSSTTSAMLLQQQQQQQQADLIARYQQQQQQQRMLHQQQQQQQLLRNQQQQQQQMLDPSSNNVSRLYGATAQMGQQPTNFQEMMLLQQQQHSRGDDALFNNNINSSNNFASLTGYGGGATPTGLARSQQQQQRLQQQSDLLQHQLSNQQLQQQQRLMLNESLFADPIEHLHQQQLQIEQQLRRRSSMSSGVASISPLLGPSDHHLPQQQQHQMTGARPQLSIGTSMNNPNNINNNQLFGSGMTGPLTDFGRFSNSAPLIQQQSRLSSLSNQAQFNSNNNNVGNRPTSLLSSSAMLHPDEIAIIRNADMELARRDKKKRSRTFPEKLMAAMLDHEDERAVAWLPDGKSFVIVNPDLFVNEVLRGDFKQAKYASFVRKLHRWGFTRLTSGTGTDCFHHPQFNRNFPDWSSRITCVPMKEASKDVPTIAGRTTSATATKLRPIKHANTKDTDAASDAAAVDRGIMEKPPSLAGVERFIRGTTFEGDTGVNFDSSSSTIRRGSVADPYDTSKHSDATAGSRLQLFPIETTTTTTRDNQQPEMEGEPGGARATI